MELFLEELKRETEQYIAKQQGHVGLFFYDLNGQAGFSVRGDEAMPSASTIKLVIMAELLRRVREGSLSLDQKILLTEEMKTGGDGILKELEPGHSFTLKELLTLMIIISDNEATNLLIDLLGMEEINGMAKSLGLKEAVLGRRMMDGEARKQGRDNYICADDMGKILKAVWEGSCVDREASGLMLDILKRQQQSGRLQLYLPEEVEVAHKCGDLDLVENDGGIVLLSGRPYILVVLTSKTASNKEGREIIGTLSKIVYDRMSEK